MKRVQMSEREKSSRPINTLYATNVWENLNIDQL